MKKSQHRHKARRLIERARMAVRGRDRFFPLEDMASIRWVTAMDNRTRVTHHALPPYRLSDLQKAKMRAIGAAAVHEHHATLIMQGFDCAGNTRPHCAVPNITIFDEAHIVQSRRFTDELARRGGGPVHEVEE